MRSLYEIGLLVEERLDALRPRVVVFSETPPDESSRGAGYVIVDIDPGMLTYLRAANPLAGHSPAFQLRCCGSGPAQARQVVDLVRLRMHGWRPWPSDLSIGAALEVDAGPVVRDDTVPGDPRWSYTLKYQIDNGETYG